jgi:hypothetical protein
MEVGKILLKVWTTSGSVKPTPFFFFYYLLACLFELSVRNCFSYLLLLAYFFFFTFPKKAGYNFFNTMLFAYIRQ